MNRTYIITGANGHLGNTILRTIDKTKNQVRGLILPGENPYLAGVNYYFGDVTKPETLPPLFENTFGSEVYVIHTAGIISIENNVSEKLRQVNVGGTKNIVDLCKEYKVKRLVYVSSVHAIPEGEKSETLTEISHFSPDEVIGGYAKTKAEATQIVLDAAKEGLNAVVVHPSGILGPYDNSGNHLVQLVKDYIKGKLPACVKGGYDFVDVRDVAAGCLLAAEKGRQGECYILSNRHYEIKDILAIAKTICGGKRIPVLPMWMAKMAEPFLRKTAEIRKRRPLYTKYSLHTLTANDKFSHEKATKELGYHPRDIKTTIADTLFYIRRAGVLAGGKLQHKSGKSSC